ncbi:PIN domain-containing protein [Streptomyces sp. NPDC005531]|uniref:PIN domain-containing protein n=1 Tax=Streptomyces sp. NPDC005531 TaxID=3364722 RepID=UPI003684F56B
MLIFDTNAVNDLDPHGAKADLLRLLGKAGLGIAAPWVVLEELTAHKLHDYQRAFDLMRRQHQELSALEPNLAGPTPVFQGDRFAEYWRKQYSEIFHTIPTSQKALRAAVLREAACMKPAKVDKTKKSGGRDVAIWFSILEYLENNPTEDVFFVSANTTDFGAPDEWPFPLDLDLGDKEARVTHLLTFEGALEKFTQPTEAPADIREKLIARLSQPNSVAAMNREVWGRRIRTLFKSKSKGLPSEFHLTMEPQSIGDIECRVIDTSIWYWSKVSWQICALQGGSATLLAFSWDTSILFPEEEEGGISLLRSGPLTEVDPEDLSEGLKESLSDVLNYETARLSDVSYQAEVEDQQEQSIEFRNKVQHRAGKIAANLESTESAFRYEQMVIAAIHRSVGPVQYVGNAAGFGIDAILETPEGTIGVVIKFGHSVYEINRINAIRREIADAVITITNRPVVGRPKLALQDPFFVSHPHEVVRWVKEADDSAIARAVHTIRHKLSAPEI